MADLETTAHEAVAKVQPMLEALQDAQRDAQDAVRYVERLRAQLAAEREALEAAVESMRLDAGAIEQALASRVPEAAANLDRLTEVVGLADQAWSSAISQEATAVTDGTTLLSELGTRVTEHADLAEAATDATVALANGIADNLETAIEAVEQAVGMGLATMVAEWRRAGEAAVERLTDFFDHKIEQVIADKQTDMKEKLARLHELLDQAMKGITEHTQEVATYTIDRWAQLFAAQLELTRTQMQGATEMIGSITQLTRNDAGQIQVAAGLVTDEQQHAAEAMTKLGEGFNNLRGLWATYGIG